VERANAPPLTTVFFEKGNKHMSNEIYDIRLPDGSLVQWTAQQIADYEDDWQMNLSVRDAKGVEDGCVRYENNAEHRDQAMIY
jgi:hypothetical protein